MAKTRLILDSSRQYKYKYRVREYVFTHTKVAYKQKNVKHLWGHKVVFAKILCRILVLNVLLQPLLYFNVQYSLQAKKTR